MDKRVLIAATFALLCQNGGRALSLEFVQVPLGQYNVYVSDDGSNITGWLGYPGVQGVFEAQTWSPSTGLATLGRLPGDTRSIPRGISADGLVVVGVSYNDDTLVRRTFRWSASTGLIDLGRAPGADSVTPGGVSPDGAFVTGLSGNIGASYQPYIWSQAQGLKELGLPPSGMPDGVQITSGVDVSLGGRVAVSAKTKRSGSGGFQAELAYLWSEATGYQSLGPLPAGWTRTFAVAISDDGLTMLGVAAAEPSPDHFRIPFLWRSETGMVPLPQAADEVMSDSPLIMTPDASIVIGNRWYTSDPTVQLPFIWDAPHGVRDLRQVLSQQHGFTPGFPYYVLDISADTRTLLVLGEENLVWRLQLDAPLVDRGGDFDGDFDVDGQDFLKWQRGESPNPLSAGDLADWQANFGVSSLAASTVVPEPAMTTLLFMGMIAMGASRCRRMATVFDALLFDAPELPSVP